MVKKKKKSKFSATRTYLNFIAPQSFSGGGLVFLGKMVTMERVWWVTMERV